MSKTPYVAIAIIIDVSFVIAVGIVTGRLSQIIATVFLAFFVSVLIHELSHAFVGTLVGAEVIGLAIGPVNLDFSSDRVRIRRNNLKGLLGAAIFEPIDKSPKDALVCWRRMILAGPLSNIALATLLVWLSCSMYSHQFEAQWKLLVTAFISGAIGLACFLPMNRGKFNASDGARYFSLRKGGPVAENIMRSQRIAYFVISATRPREWPAALLPVADHILAASNQDAKLETKVLATVFKYGFLVDSGYPNDALVVLESSLASVGHLRKQDQPDPADPLAELLARHYLLWNGDRDRASTITSYLSQKGPSRKTVEHGMSIALHFVYEGDLENAKSLVTALRNAIVPKMNQSGLAQMEYDLLDIVEQRVKDASHFQAPLAALTESAAD